ncbi:MAG TPA: 2-dehydropantoate 2-reductase [Burkholderiales bacterium]|nr:2-dehydropantoate 2-reductase [Burkholderiales bacterium]
MKLCIFGAGAVGGHLAAKLAAAGHDVSVVARGAHLQAIREKGLKLIHGEKIIHGRVRASERSDDLGPQDFVLVTLKANMLGAFADAAAPLLGPETGVVFVQNGIPWWYGRDLPRLDSGGRLAKAIAAERVIGGVAYSANAIEEPGVIRNYVPGNNMIVVGEADNRNSERIQRLRQALEKADLSSPPAKDIRAAIWSKLVQNVGNSSLGVIAGATVDEIRGNPQLGKLASTAGAETRAIAQAHGIALESAPTRPSGGHASGAVGHKTSMLQDYERGRAMEIEAQLMAPLAFARARQVATPTLDTLAALVAHKAAAKGLYEM